MGVWDDIQWLMRLLHLSQVAQVAVVLQPGLRLASAAVLLDGIAMVQGYVRQQYGAIDALPPTDRFDVAEITLLAAEPLGQQAAAFQAVQRLDTRFYDVVYLPDFDETMKVSGAQVVLRAWLGDQEAGGAVFCASGEGVGVLAEAGLLDGRLSAVPPWQAEEWCTVFPQVNFVAEQAVIEDDNVVTSRGGQADFDLAVRVIASFTSANLAHWLARHLGVADIGEAGSPATADRLLERAQEWLALRFSQNVTIDELAAAMGANRRTLHRHFVAHTGLSPIAYLQSLRIEAAKRMLERAPFTIDRIAALVGYDDTGYFRAKFREMSGVSPSRWRALHARSG